jgi:Tfp pilus assembly protein PilE
MTDIETLTLEAELVDEDAARDITKAVSGRRSIARKYVLRSRRRRPDATPAEIIQLLERHYVTAISTAGALITAGVIAADVGIAMIPGVGAATAGVKSASQQAAKKASKEAAKAAVKAAAKGAALGAAKSSAQRAAALLPAGDEQLQFEITALFGLALAEIHGMSLDQDQARALVYGLTNERVSSQQIAAMAADVATVSSGGVVETAHSISSGRTDWSHWASTLADALPGGAAQSLVRTMQTGQLDSVRENLSGKQQTVVEYGVGALSGGVARFVFGREVVSAARDAFAAAPEEFPTHLALSTGAAPESKEDEAEPNSALAALEDAAKSAGTWIADTAGTVKDGVSAGATVVASTAESATRVFRSVDIDGDGIPDEARALTAVKGVGAALSGAASAVGGNMKGLFRSKKHAADVTSTDDAAKTDA